MDPSVMQENRFTVFKFKVTVRAQMIKYMTVSDISIELLIFLHPNLVGWHIIISLRGVLFCCCCYMSVCECVEIRLLFSRSRSQARIKTLLNLYVFCIWSLGNQTRCADLILLITTPSTTMWAYTDNRTLTVSIIRYTMRGYFAAQGDKPCSSCVWWFSAEQQSHACFRFRSTSEWSAGQVILHKRVFW